MQLLREKNGVWSETMESSVHISIHEWNKFCDRKQKLISLLRIPAHPGSTLAKGVPGPLGRIVRSPAELPSGAHPAPEIGLWWQSQQGWPPRSRKKGHPPSSPPLQCPTFHWCQHSSTPHHQLSHYHSPTCIPSGATHCHPINHSKPPATLTITNDSHPPPHIICYDLNMKCLPKKALVLNAWCPADGTILRASEH
jgi:hypothetical protein